MTGGDDFFAVTKAFHNALHGEPYRRPPAGLRAVSGVQRAESAAGCSSTRSSRSFTIRSRLALIDARRSGRRATGSGAATSICRGPTRRSGISSGRSSMRYDGASSRRRRLRGSCRFRSTCSFRDRPALGQEPRAAAGVGRRRRSSASASIRSRPILTQISRFDRLKDPVGVIRAYQIVKRYTDCQLVLAGGGAADDPEGDDGAAPRCAKRRLAIPTSTSSTCRRGARSRSTRCSARRPSSCRRACARASA